MSNSKVIFFVAIALIFCACHESKNVEYKSFEVAFGDTVNRVDAKGMKQGQWVPTPVNHQKDTILYKDDNIIKRW